MFNSDVTLETFLKDYWQKKPLLFRNAFPDFCSPLNADELAGLACEEDSNARIIIETQDKPYWSVEYGPIDENRFSSLPQTNWTLLVGDVEKHVIEGRDLLEEFRFIPDWRIDDLMISYAVKGGSVGPHLDAYDVFLLQAEGQRHWSISFTEDNDSFLEDIDLRILKSFTAQQEWTLNPGDMLYLPPNVAHHGVAVDDCITCSIGFRSPSVHNLISEYAESLAVNLSQDIRFTDADIEQQEHPAEITQTSIDHIKQLLINHLKIDDDFIQKWFGEHITESHANSPQSSDQHSHTEIKDLNGLNSIDLLSTALTTKLLYSKHKDQALVFADGKSFETSLTFAQTLCQSHDIKTKSLLASIQTKNDETTLLYLISHNHLYCVD